MMRYLRLFLGLIGFAVQLVPLLAQRELFPPEDLEVIAQKWPQAQKGPMSIRYIVLQEGRGEPAAPGDRVSVLYQGTLLNGKVFDQARNPAQPFVFRVARGDVIQGWDIAIQMMKEGSKLQVIIPHEMGYGTRGEPPRIPRRASLVFEIELLKIERTTTQPPPPPPPVKKKKWWQLGDPKTK